MLEPSVEPVTSLYVHVPFCARKCEYCAFYSEASDGEIINRYVGALIRELELVAADLRPRTIFSAAARRRCLNLRQWEQILGAMERLDLTGAERMDGRMQSRHRFARTRRGCCATHGVNRISMGVQSLNETLLDRLGRIHSREMVFKSFDILARGRLRQSQPRSDVRHSRPDDGGLARDTGARPSRWAASIFPPTR